MPPHSRTGGPRRGAKAAATLALSRLSGPVPESQAVRLTSRIRHARMPTACACCLRGPFRPHLPWAEGARVRIAPRNYRLEEAMVILADWRFAHAGYKGRDGSIRALRRVRLPRRAFWRRFCGTRRRFAAPQTVLEPRLRQNPRRSLASGFAADASIPNNSFPKTQSWQKRASGAYSGSNSRERNRRRT